MPDNPLSRDVALHPTTVAALVVYAQVRDELSPHPQEPSFLVTNSGRRLHKATVWHEFDKLRRFICGNISRR